MLMACLMIVDTKIKVDLDYSSNTDIYNNRQHQQVRMTAEYRNIHVTAPG